MVMIDIYLVCGEYDRALAEIDELLSLESEFTVNSLNLRPDIDLLRAYPGFNELMAKYAYSPGT